jgi:hypothetical protein
MMRDDSKKPMTPERLQRCLVELAQWTFLWGDDFDFGPSIDVLAKALEDARKDNQFEKARTILKAYSP